MPLWWWSGERVTAQRLRWQLERLAAGGVYGVCVMNVAPTSPLYGKDADDPPFMSEPWWELFEGACRDAGALGMQLWFYDQIGFSGANFQGQVVRAQPEHAGRWIERARVCPAGGTEVATFGGWTYYSVERGFDYFSAAACARLFRMVHGRFEERVGGWFGSVIAGSFQDELPNLPTWGPGFAERFAEIAGYDPLPHLAGLWDEDGEGFRGDYHRVRAALAEEAFFRPLHEWHEQRGLLCGVDQQIGAREGLPVAGTHIYGDYPRTHRWFGAPGSDHHGDAKLHSSLAHHYGRGRVWIEAFHTSGWGGTLEETFDWLLPWIGAGANLYDPHATYYSTRAGWWEWAPPATDWRQPYWRHYGEFARAVARLCSVLTWGRHACDVGVLHPTATAQAGHDPDAVYLDVIGRMKWFDVRPGALNRLGVDFDVLDDDTVAGAAVAGDRLVTRDESYAAIVLPGCEVLEAATARRLVEFVDGGGLLIAVGPVPSRVAGRGEAVSAPGEAGASPAAGVSPPADPVAELAARFASGAARVVPTADALADLPSPVRAPVPTLLRRDGERAVLFVPAVHPRATEIDIAVDDPEDWHAWTSGLSYRFEPVLDALEVEVGGVSGEPELWEPFSGARRRVECEPVEDGVRVRVPFTDGPCALLVWGEPGDALDPVAPAGVVETLDGEWDVEVVSTLEDEFGDLAAPAAGVVETWQLERDGEPVHATFAPRAEWSRDGGPWRPLVWSPSRGIFKDPLHADFLGPSGRVPEEFMRFGAVRAGETVRVRAVVGSPQALRTHLAVGAAATKRAAVNGKPVPVGGGGYLVAGPVELAAGENALELWLEPQEDREDLRGHFAFVADLDGYARPEWMRAAGEVSPGSIVAFATRVARAADVGEVSVLVGANGPCRVLVDGVEVGRQGGFDPYAEIDKDRLQPYTFDLPAGEHELRLELLELGRTRPAALFDGIVGDATIRSDATWSAWRDGEPVAIDLRLDQRGDPAANHAWRRPHPLPAAAWLEPGRAGADAGAALTIGPEDATHALRVAAPPGARTARFPLTTGDVVVAVDGPVVEVEGGEPTGPVAFTVGPGRMPLVDWQDAGLANFSGGVRYRRRVEASGAVRLDLGEVRGTAEVFVDGASAGVRVCSPYAFDLDLGEHGATLEILVLNTLGPHLDAVGPTPYVFKGQRRSGLFGPVRLVARAPAGHADEVLGHRRLRQ